MLNNPHMTRGLDWVLPPAPEEPPVDDAVYATMASTENLASDAQVSHLYTVWQMALESIPVEEARDVR